MEGLLQRAVKYLGHSQVSKAVIAVPAKFDARQRAATVEAFRLAGLQVRELSFISRAFKIMCRGKRRGLRSASPAPKSYFFSGNIL